MGVYILFRVVPDDGAAQLSSRVSRLSPTLRAWPIGRPASAKPARPPPTFHRRQRTNPANSAAILTLRDTHVRGIEHPYGSRQQKRPSSVANAQAMQSTPISISTECCCGCNITAKSLALPPMVRAARLWACSSRGSRRQTRQKPRRICEVGLNRGESAMAWLCTFPTAHYLGFDLLQYNASVHALKFLKLAFPGRVKIIGGSSAETVKAHALAKPGTCDVVSVDGGHQFVNAWSDFSYMRLLARDGPHTVVMDDVRCTTWWCKPPTVTWHHFRESGVVRERGCVIAGCCTGWCWGEFNRSAPQPNAEAVCKGSPRRAAAITSPAFRRRRGSFGQRRRRRWPSAALQGGMRSLLSLVCKYTTSRIHSVQYVVEEYK